MSRLVRAAGLVSIGTLVSRVLGLGRDAVRGALLGARWLSDAVDVAFKVPNLLRDLFAEGAFSGAFVPTLTVARERNGDAAAFAVLNRVLSTLAVYVGGLVVLLVVFAPALVRAIAAPSFVRSEYFELTVQLVRILSPFLLFISLAAAAMGALNVFGRFFVPALSPAVQNALLVCGGLFVYTIAGGGREAAVPWALLLLCGGFLQFVIQLPALYREGWRPGFRPDLLLRAPETRQIVQRMVPVAGGLAAAHVSVLINTRLATADEGGASNLYYAFRLVHLPVGLVGVAVGTALLAHASREAARGNTAGLRARFGEGLGVGLALAVPACAGLLALGEPLARMLFLWGEIMTAQEVDEIGRTIRYYAPAAVFFCLVKVCVPVFYAQGRVRIPVVASLVGVAMNLACALSLHPSLRWNGLALALGVGQAANLAVLLWAARRMLGGPAAGLAPRLGKIVLASGVCGGVAFGLAGVLPGGAGVAERLLRGLVPVAAGAAAYFLAGRLLRSTEILALSRIGRRAPFDEGAGRS